MYWEGILITTNVVFFILIKSVNIINYWGGIRNCEDEEII